ncbi:Mite allergen Eur m 3 [Sarcoptes scabiei]|uniref:Mite allergen Eur m 3 n=1 Tax=Sarcoptes scabiei TaxID=52283 RepID=A0A834VBI6_SARSC|nr:Mite allergen Eur m 3 [Sarcoptes scabiei]
MFRNYWIFIIEFQILAFQTTKFSPTSSIEWKEFPFIVSLQRIKGLNELEHFCAGTILDDHWILTAAHCLQDSIVVANDIEHIVALTKLSDQRRKFESKIFRLNLALIDDRFDSNTMDNDIGLVRTIESIEFLQHRIHWNQSVIDRTVPKIASMEKCSHLYRINGSFVLPNNVLCYGGDHSDSCQGDSGGPLFWTNATDHHFHLLGIVSFGIYCGRVFPGIYTDISHYRDWITANLRNNFEPT